MGRTDDVELCMRSGSRVWSQENGGETMGKVKQDIWGTKPDRYKQTLGDRDGERRGYVC